MIDIYGAIQQLQQSAGNLVTTGTEALDIGPLAGADLWLIPSPTVPIPFPVPISCQFNPEQLEFEKRARWKKRKTAHKDVAAATYSGGEPQELSLDLFFDTTDSGADVRAYTTPLMLLTQRIPLINQPPLCIFQWGLIMSPPSYVDRVSVKYTFFNPHGTPLRAQVKVKLVEYDLGILSKLPLNPTTVSEARKTWVVLEGQSLDWIAYQEYGDAAHWRHIARTNNLMNPMNLQPGQILKLTPLP